MYFVFLSSGEREQGRNKNADKSSVITNLYWLTSVPLVNYVACNFQPSPAAASKTAETFYYFIRF